MNEIPGYLDYPYEPGFIHADVADRLFKTFLRDIPWERRENVPRAEYWMNDFNRPYTYGSGAGIRTYEAGLWDPGPTVVRDALWLHTGVCYEGCFMNLYEAGTDALGWHSDDDPGIDHSKPIAVVSLGSERVISLRSIDRTWHVQRKLGHGSFLEMPAGSQQTHQHKIAKASDMTRAAPRISLTFRSLLRVVSS